jgi:3',5'-cyclic AMP phosphodiesterase CpdA
LKKAIASINSLDQQPDFIVFTGDLTHTTEDARKRRDRMAEFRDITGGLRARTLYFMAGEHDAALDRGEAYQQHFGELHYSFDHRGVHFIALDNVSDPAAIVGEAQLKWLEADLQRQKKDAPIVVFTYRPLFDLYLQWDWATRDAAAVTNALLPYQNVRISKSVRTSSRVKPSPSASRRTKRGASPSPATSFAAMVMKICLAHSS